MSRLMADKVNISSEDVVLEIHNNSTRKFSNKGLTRKKVCSLSLQ